MKQNKGNRPSHKGQQNTVMYTEMTKSFIKDGDDHICISGHAVTKIGRLLTPTRQNQFTIPGMGSFMSPLGFVKWLSSGNDHYRDSPGARYDGQIDGFHGLLLYGKLFQLLKNKDTIKRHENVIMNMPFADYNVTDLGIKIFNGNRDNVTRIREIAIHVLTDGTENFDWNKINLGWVPDAVKDKISKIIENQGGPAETFTPKKPKANKAPKTAKSPTVEQSQAIISEGGIPAGEMYVAGSSTGEGPFIPYLDQPSTAKPYTLPVSKPLTDEEFNEICEEHEPNVGQTNTEQVNIQHDIQTVPDTLPSEVDPE